MLSASSKIFIFDVDGVIVDSTEECLVIAWNAWKSLNNHSSRIQLPENAPPEYANHFRALRNYVRTMGEYMIVFHSTFGEIKTQVECDNKLNKIPIEYQNEFARHFFKERQTYKKHNYTQWLKLHFIYPGIKELIQLVSETFNMYVVTGKDKESTMSFFQELQIPILEEKIYDKEIAKNKMEGIQHIAQIESVELQDIIFLDDNVTHLLIPKKHEVQTLLADWGYGMKEHFEMAKKNRINVVSLKDIYYSVVHHV